MANVKINKKLFEREIGKLDEKMQERISMMGTPIDKITDEEIEIEIFPNRPDLLSYHGFKRALLGFLGKRVGLINYKINKPEKDYLIKIDNSVKEVRPYTVCAIVKTLKFDDEKIKEIIDIQEKLHLTLGRKRKKLAIGIYPLEKISLPITYEAIEPDKIKFTPLESTKEMSGLEILQKHSAGKEYANLLKGKSKFPIFKDSKNQILSMPPIINSELTGRITKNTEDIFIECSGFDLPILEKCLNILVTTLIDIGGKAYQMKLEYSKPIITPNLTPEKMKIKTENANKVLGLKLSDKEIKNLIERMGYNYNKEEVEIPSWRTDILHEIDLIEDVAIAYGYENFIPEIPQISTIGEENKRKIISKRISEILMGLGLIEVSNYHLTTKSEQTEKMNLIKKNLIEVEDSKTEYSILREDLSHYLLKNLSENIDAEYPQRIFEIGTIFQLENSKISEKENLAVAIAPGNFTELKQIIEYIKKMTDINLEIIEPKEIQPYLIEGRTGDIILNNKKIGSVGEVHPKILRNWKIKMPVSILEISLEEIFREFEKKL